jgi:hypothetical protein
MSHGTVLCTDHGASGVALTARLPAPPAGSALAVRGEIATTGLGLPPWVTVKTALPICTVPVRVR